MCILEDESKLIPSSIWQHKNNGKHYKLETANIQIQENNIWIDAVAYKALDRDNIESDILYARSRHEFLLKFKCIEM